MSDTLRRFLLAIFLLGVIGISGELLLMAHFGDFYQQIPLALCALSLAGAAAVVVKPGRRIVNLFRAIMALFVLSGVAGAVLHFQVNMEFQLEMDPSLSGINLYRKAILAKTPPALAPGAMVQLGLIGLAYTFRRQSMTRILTFALAVVLAAPAYAQVGKSLGVVDANTIAEADLAKLPAMTPAIAKAIVAARPFDSILDLNNFLLGQKLTQEQANELYKHVFIHINLNTATAAEMMLVPGAGKRMAHEFEEYRPWKSWAQFEKEIGKYVDAKEVARLAQYAFLAVNINTAADDDVMSIPGAGRRMVREFKEYRPWKTQAQFEKEIGKYVDAREVKRLWRYVVIQ